MVELLLSVQSVELLLVLVLNPVDIYSSVLFPRAHEQLAIFADFAQLSLGRVTNLLLKQVVVLSWLLIVIFLNLVVVLLE